MFVAQALGPGAGRAFLLEQAAYQLRGAVLSMWAASGESVPDTPPTAVAAADERLRNGDTDGYTSLRSEIDRLRLLSRLHLNGLADGIRASETRIESLQASESWLYLAYVFFNLLGLMVTMCKDLPVWRSDGHGARAG